MHQFCLGGGGVAPKRKSPDFRSSEVGISGSGQEINASDFGYVKWTTFFSCDFTLTITLHFTYRLL